MNLCIHCRHYEAGRDAAFDRCLKFGRIEPVRGVFKPTYCADARMYGTQCGLTGLGWEPHPSTFEVSKEEASHVADF